VTANTSSGHSSGYSTGSGGVLYYISGYNESDPQVIAYRQAMADYDEELKVYYARQQQISDAISIFSPISNFYKLNEVLTSKYVPGQQSYSIYGSYFYTYGTSKELNVFESLAYRWTYLLIFIVEIIAAFGLSYMLFMRADVT
jgi:ABC-type transport system involved in multi-copper enzyme maturation permease subunit